MCVSPDKVNWGKMEEYWRRIADPYYYSPVTSLMGSSLSGLHITKSARGEDLEGEFVVTGRVLSPRTSSHRTVGE